MATREENQRPAKRAQKEICRACAHVRAALEGEIRALTCVHMSVSASCAWHSMYLSREMGLGARGA